VEAVPNSGAGCGWDLGHWLMPPGASLARYRASRATPRSLPLTLLILGMRSPPAAPVVGRGRPTHPMPSPRAASPGTSTPTQGAPRLRGWATVVVRVGFFTSRYPGWIDGLRGRSAAFDVVGRSVAHGTGDEHGKPCSGRRDTSAERQPMWRGPGGVTRSYCPRTRPGSHSVRDRGLRGGAGDRRASSWERPLSSWVPAGRDGLGGCRWRST
jgi:hypothetical protein